MERADAIRLESPAETVVRATEGANFPVVDDALRAAARLLATRHADAFRTPDVDAQGTRDALSSRWEANFAQVRALFEDGHVPEGVEEVEYLVRRYLAGREQLFDMRIEQGRIVDGHGDLLAEDIFCLDDGPRVLDCLEFDDHLRHVDGLDDAAFLAMDLELLDAPEAAAFFLARYSEYSGDPAPPSLRHHYVAYRAFVRAKVSLIQARQGAPGAAHAAQRLITTTRRHLRASAIGLTLVGGLPGSGKSTLSGALADRLGVTLLSSDRLRKELAGIPVDRPAPGTGRVRPRLLIRGKETVMAENIAPNDHERLRIGEAQVQVQAVRALAEGLGELSSQDNDMAAQAARGVRLAHELPLSQGL